MLRPCGMCASWLGGGLNSSGREGQHECGQSPAGPRIPRVCLEGIKGVGRAGHPCTCAFHRSCWTRQLLCVSMLSYPLLCLISLPHRLAGQLAVVSSSWQCSGGSSDQSFACPWSTRHHLLQVLCLSPTWHLCGWREGLIEDAALAIPGDLSSQTPGLLGNSSD